MKNRIILKIAAAGILFLCNDTELAEAQNPTSPDQATINDVALANRILASADLGVLDAWGHVSARSPTNPNHYFIARYVSPGVVTAADIIENDLDSNPVKGERKDQYQERYIHGEIYKLRPDVMAVLHAHTPELVAFGVSSVPLHTEGAPLPNFDIRTVNKGVPGIITNAALGKSLAESLGKSPAALMFGHGVAVTGKSVADLVTRVHQMRRDAQVQMMSIALGGKVDNSEPAHAPAAQATANAAPVSVAGASSNGTVRTWEAWKAMMMERIAAEPKLAASTPRSTAEDLVLANKMLASPELGVLDTLGHVSMRNPANPSHFFITRSVSAARATANDVIEEDLDCNPISGPRSDQYQEVYIHCAIYKARPDVRAIVHGHTPELVAFSQSSIPLRTVVNSARFMFPTLPKFDIRSTGEPNMVNDAAKGKMLADTLADRPGVLMANHGFVVVDSSLYTLVSRAHDLRLNAQIQLQVILLGGKINYVEPLPGAVAFTPAPGDTAATPSAPSGSGGGTALDRAWEYYRQMVARESRR